MRYAQIRSTDISNGEGIGVALFVQGCRFQCDNCFNSEAWDFNGGNNWTDIIGAEFIKLIDKPHISRISILGGEPLARENVEEVYYLILKIREKYPSKNIWLYTGYTLEEIFSQTSTDNISSEQQFRIAIAKSCDVMVDGRYLDALRDPKLHYRGSSNQRLIDMQKTLKEGQVVLWRA